MFFPFRDHNPSERVPLVTYTLIGLNILIFLLYFPELSGSPAALFGFYQDWAMIPQEVALGGDRHTLITSMFLHGGWMHLAGNMLFLWLYGDNVEDLLGPFRYLLFYLACGVAASLGHLFADPTSGVPTVGASGAIAGVMGGYLLMFPRARVDVLLFFVVILRVVTVPAWALLCLWFGMQVFNGVAAQSGVGGVAYWAHIVGFVAGLALMFPLWIGRGGTAFWQDGEGRPHHNEVVTRIERRSGIPRISRQRGNSITESRIPQAGRRSRGPISSPWRGR